MKKINTITLIIILILFAINIASCGGETVTDNENSTDTENTTDETLTEEEIDKVPDEDTAEVVLTYPQSSATSTFFGNSGDNLLSTFWAACKIPPSGLLIS